MSDPVEARLAEIEADAATVTESLLKLQAWVSKPGSLKWSRDGLDALARLLARLKEHDERSREGMVTVYDHHGKYVGCMGIERWKHLLADEQQERETNETFVSSGGDPDVHG